MNSVSRREVLAMMSVAAAGFVVNSGCQEREEKSEKKKQTTVKRVSPVYEQTIQCGRAEKIWTGPHNAVVQVTLEAGANCTASISFVDKATETTADAGVARAGAGATVTVSVTVPNTKVLAIACTGPEGGKCKGTLTAVDPSLPDNVTQGAAQAIPVNIKVKNPDAPPTVGTPIEIDCGKNAVLWSGTSSYVTVQFKGSDNCLATVRSEGTEAATETTNSLPFCRTLGPITKLTGICNGTDTSSCEFQVTETIELPA